MVSKLRQVPDVRATVHPKKAGTFQTSSHSALKFNFLSREGNRSKAGAKQKPRAKAAAQRKPQAKAAAKRKAQAKIAAKRKAQSSMEFEKTRILMVRKLPKNVRPMKWPSFAKAHACENSNGSYVWQFNVVLEQVPSLNLEVVQSQVVAVAVIVAHAVRPT